MAIIDAKNISKLFDTSAAAVMALTDVSLSFEQGEFTIIKGPSGSGKTTLLSILGCLLSPTSGDLTILDQEVVGASKKHLSVLRLTRIGFIFQNFNLLEALTVKENLTIVSTLRGADGRASLHIAENLLADMGLDKKAGALSCELSQGEKQRVAIARAFMNDPDIIIADEPTANLDSKTGRMIIEKTRELGKDKTVIVATHDERIIETADRIVSMEDGRVIDIS